MSTPKVLVINVVSGPEQGASARFTRVGVIGRVAGTSVQLVLSDVSVSRHHARVSQSGGTWFVTDLGSSNGTSLNTEPLVPNKPAPMREQGVLQVGGPTGVVLQFKVVEAKKGVGGAGPKGGLTQTQRTPIPPKTPGTKVDIRPVTPEEPPDLFHTDPEPALTVKRPKPPDVEAVRELQRSVQQRDAQVEQLTTERTALLAQLEEARARLKVEHRQRKEVEAEAQASKAELARLGVELKRVAEHLKGRENDALQLNQELEAIRRQNARLVEGAAGQRAGVSAAPGQADLRLQLGRARAICDGFARTLTELESAITAHDPTGVSARALSRAIGKLGDLRTLLSYSDR